MAREFHLVLAILYSLIGAGLAVLGVYLIVVGPALASIPCFALIAACVFFTVHDVRKFRAAE